ncbi:hypothetical protein HK105_206701 [Polyrhizophydium stewartii]|uniref:Uncharacterized protein n=1 Tax=Polyrhizophydium stewartii TaxID=2732419 RepID=A0ABR4N2U2_9FUNG
MSLFRHAAKPYIALLVACVGLGCAGSGFLIARNLRTDPTLVIYKKSENPFPWVNVPQDRNLKLYAVANKFETKGIKEYYIENRK